MNYPRKSIHIAALNQGEIRVELARVIIDVMQASEYRVSLDFPAAKPIANNRNTIVKKFLEEQSEDYLMMIDADIIPPRDIWKMADYSKDIIAATCFAYRGEGIIPLVLMKNEHERYEVLPTDKPEGVTECDAVGTGAIMLSRRVLEDNPAPFLNEYDESGIKTQGLDLAFCRRAKEKGYKVHAHLDMVCGHWTPVDLKQIYESFQEDFEYQQLRRATIG